MHKTNRVKFNEQMNCSITDDGVKWEMWRMKIDKKIRNLTIDTFSESDILKGNHESFTNSIQ